MVDDTFNFVFGPMLRPPLPFAAPAYYAPKLVSITSGVYDLRLEIRSLGHAVYTGVRMRYANLLQGQYGHTDLQYVKGVKNVRLPDGMMGSGDLLAVCVAPFNAEGEGPQACFQMFAPRR